MQGGMNCQIFPKNSHDKEKATTTTIIIINILKAQKALVSEGTKII